MPRWPLLAAVVLAGCPGEPAPKPVDTSPGGVVQVTDPARPEVPTLDRSAFTFAQDCGACHPTHYTQWKTSMHAYAMVDPVFRAATALRQADHGGADDPFCTQCHSAIGTRSHDITPGYRFEELSDITLEGITCESCHKISEVVRDHNAGHLLDERGPIRGPIADPVFTSFHASEYSPLFESSELCGSCHDVVETNGLNLERPYAEWIESPATDQTCASCHMPRSRGPAAVDGPERELHSHEFVGVDLPLLDGFATVEEMAHIRGNIAELLSGAGSIVLAADPVTPGDVVNLRVTLQNNIPAHNLPTGSTFNRELWLELSAYDAEGALLYRTGDLDGNGDLRGHWSELDPYGDHDLIALNTRLIDGSGNPTFLTHNAEEHLFETLSPLYERTYTLFVPTTADTRGPIRVESRLLFRQYAPWLVRKLGFADLAPRIEVFEIDGASLEVPLR